MLIGNPRYIKMIEVYKHKEDAFDVVRGLVAFDPSDPRSGRSTAVAILGHSEGLIRLSAVHFAAWQRNREGLICAYVIAKEDIPFNLTQPFRFGFPGRSGRQGG
jgi:hypothetical protein